jgi:hypothetical protein
MCYLRRSGILLAGALFCLTIGVIGIDAQGRKPHSRHETSRRHRADRRDVNNQRNMSDRRHETSTPANLHGDHTGLTYFFTYRSDLTGRRSGFTRNNGFSLDPPDYSPSLQNDSRYRKSPANDHTPYYDYDWGYLVYPSRSHVNIKLWFGNPRPNYLWPSW